MLANLIGSMIMILVGWMLVAPLNSYGYGLGWISFGITSLIGGIILITSIKYIFYVNDFDSEPEQVKNKKHKQTYFEYVRERLAVEKLMKKN